LPENARSQLIEISAGFSALPFQKRALETLAKAKPQNVLEYLCEVVEKTRNDQIYHDAIRRMGEAQRFCAWRADVWKRVNSLLAFHRSPEDWIAFAESLGITGCLEAISYLRDMAGEHFDGRADIRVYKAAKGSVNRVSEAWLKIERDPKEWMELLKAIGVQAIPDPLQKVISESQRDVKALKEMQSLADNQIESDFQKLRPNAR